MLIIILGPGFWFDINANKNLFEENLSEFNSWEGLIYELSCGCEIRNNILRWNGLEPREGLFGEFPLLFRTLKMLTFITIILRRHQKIMRGQEVYQLLISLGLSIQMVSVVSILQKGILFITMQL